MNREDFIIECKKIGLELSNDILNKIDLYKDLLIEWNNKFNVTAITDENNIYLKHFYDSICLVKSMDLNNKKICDFGTGAGFPGMVLAIIFNNSNITLIESNSKKILFLNEVKKKLNLDNVIIINDRVEKYAKENREVFDIVTCRAVSSLNIILELASAMIKENGYFLPMKANVEEEIKNSEQKSKQLNLLLKDKIEYKLPVENADRTILKYRKTGKTDLKYPREYNVIKKENIRQ